MRTVIGSLRHTVLVRLLFLVALGVAGCGEQERPARDDGKVLITESDAVRIAKEQLKLFGIREESASITVHWSSDRELWLVVFSDNTEYIPSEYFVLVSADGDDVMFFPGR